MILKLLIRPFKKGRYDIFSILIPFTNLLLTFIVIMNHYAYNIILNHYVQLAKQSST